MMDPKERFYRQFQVSATGEFFWRDAYKWMCYLHATLALQEQISQLATFAAVGGERQDAIEHILAGISRLTNEVADAADFVPPYDQRTYSQVRGSACLLLPRLTGTS
jgi:hypothetical protein